MERLCPRKVKKDDILSRDKLSLYLPNSISSTQPFSSHSMPAHVHSDPALRKRSLPTNGRELPQSSVALGFAEHCNQSSPPVEK